MKIIYLFVLSILCAPVYAQRAGEYKALLNDKITVNYPDYTVTAGVSNPKNNFIARPGKTYHWYSANRIRTTQGGFSGKLLDGNYTEYYLSKDLKEKGSFKNGLKHGEWLAWSADGKLKSRERWRTGAKYGDYFVYDPAGKLLEQGTYRNDKLNGKVRKYVADSVVVTRYKNGKSFVPKNSVADFLKRVNPFRRAPKKK
ncbi:toxin-antitoxin system YwqK family antitoxin [Hufsiella ginkgonis]|uniref:Toxin-antitoxin system YwqK family antitoxin n=1 Tax=Hufsiella ginkgonis TaxID=2695274 RepID=A0A7K1XXS6_9SPHI|nr:hypothetical protein [Hufsiella ginkgonis]MXV15752.1 hypothetical protein [Hufsiella ginkgonis]